MKKIMILVAAAALAGTFTLTGAGSAEAVTGKVSYAYMHGTYRYCMIQYDTGTGWNSLPKKMCYYQIPTSATRTAAAVGYDSMWVNCSAAAASGETVVARGTSEGNCSATSGGYAGTITSLDIMNN
ncbi:MAG: hypothetical protein D3922_14115 [Candidatus Electrothrix sp. AR1]|nr:hypothetical protein [Candidatus Electrothrix sp. AR1]